MTYTSMQADARKATDNIFHAVRAVRNPATALDFVNLTDDFIRAFPHCVQAMSDFVMSAVETQVTERAATHIKEFGTDNQRRVAEELYNMPEPMFLSADYLDNEEKIAPVQDALAAILCEVHSTGDYIEKKPAIEALINSVPFGRDELHGLVATRLRTLLVCEAIADMVATNQADFGDIWRYNLWAAYIKLPCDARQFALAFLDHSNLGPRFYHPAALDVNAEPIYYCMAADKVALLAKFTCYEDTAYLVQTLYAAINEVLKAKDGDAGDRRLNRLASAMRETFKTGSLSYWEHPALANKNSDED